MDSKTTRQIATILRPLFAGALVLSVGWPVGAAAAPILLATAGPAPNESCGGATITESSSTSARASYTCSGVFATVSAEGLAQPGNLGVSSTGHHFGGPSIPNSQLATVSYEDLIVFRRLDPSLSSIVPVSLNLDLDGSLSSSDGGSSYITGLIAIPGLFSGLFEQFTGSAGMTLLGLTAIGTVGPNVVDARLTTRTANAIVDENYVLQLTMTGSTVVNRGADALLDFLHTFSFPSDVPVFNLPAGYTANAGDYLVNNRFIDTDTPAAVPEPGTLSLVGLALGGMLIARRRRRA